MKFRHHSFLFLILLFIPIAIFFYPVWGQGKLPLPADTIPGLYHPMRDALKSEYPNGPPYKNFLITDAVRQQYPWRQFAIDELKAGRIPWWNPYNFSGTPHLANFQSAVFYPLNLIFWFTSFPIGWTILVISQQVLGALFLYLYLKSLSLKPLACIFGALTWIFSGFFVAWLEWNTAVHVAIWTPLILLATDKLTGSTIAGYKQIIWSTILFLSLTTQFFAGYPQPWIYLSILQGVYLVIKLYQKSQVKQIVKIGVIYLFFMITISIQLLSSLEFSHLSNRNFDQGNILDKTDWFLPYQNLIQLIVPDFFGNPATLNYWGVFNYTEFVSFIGIFPAVIILSLLLAKKLPSKTLFFGFFAFLSIILAVKNPLSLLQFQFHLPLLESSQPSRWLVVTDLSLAILAAIGLDHHLHHHLNYKKVLAPTLLIGLILGLAWVLVLIPGRFSLAGLATNLAITKRNLILPSLELIFIAIVIISHYLYRHHHLYQRISFLPTLFKQKQALYTLVIIMSVMSGIRFAIKYISFSDPKFLYPQSQIITYIQQHAGINRYITLDRRLMAPNFNLAYRIYSVEGYDPLYLQSYGRLIYASETNYLPDQSKPFNRIVTTDNYSSPIVNLLGVKYILSLTAINDPKLKPLIKEGDTYLYENLSSFPRAFVVADTFNPFQPAPLIPAEITDYQPQQIAVSLKPESKGLLILSDSYYPGWQALVDGQPIPILNWYGLRAVTVNSSDQVVIFKYTPTIISRFFKP